MTTPIARVRRILLVRNDRLGDLVLTLPAIQAVRRQWPRAHVAALVQGYTAPLLNGTQDVDEVLIDDPADSPGQLAQRLRAHDFAAALVFNTNTRNCRAVWQAGIRRRVTWGYKPAGWLLGTHCVKLRRSHPPVHEAEFALAFVRALGGAAVMANLSPQLHVDTATRERVAARVRRDLGAAGPLFGVHPGNGASAYNWPLDHYVELVNRLALYGRVMITGSRSEQPLVDSLRAQLARSATNRVAAYTDFALNELVAAISLQTVLTASSTGPMHVAGILQTPVVALFSPHPAHVPAKWAPLGRQHTLLVAPLEPGESAAVPRERGEALMSRIGVVEVLAANLRHAGNAVSAGQSQGWARAS